MRAPWINKLLGVHVADRSPTADYWYQDANLVPPAGMLVTERNAVTVPAVYDCLQVISRPIASLRQVMPRK